MAAFYKIRQKLDVKVRKKRRRVLFHRTQHTLRKSFDQPPWKKRRGVVKKPNQGEKSCFGLLLTDLHNASLVPQTNVSVVA